MDAAAAQAERIGIIRRHFHARQEYSAAIVATLCDSLTQSVHRLRARLQYIIVARPQLTPHLTVAYIGRREGRQLQRIWAAVRRMKAPAIPLSTAGIGFFDSGGCLSNIHLKVMATEAVTAAHLAALRTLCALNESSDTPYQGARYVPHISIFDGVRELQSPFPADTLDPTILHGCTAGLHIMARTESL